MIKHIVASLVLAVAAIGAAPRADAGIVPIVWGMSDHFDTLAALKIPDEVKAEVPAEWTKGASAELTRHSESFTLFWIAGLSISDKGYAIHVPGVDKYWEVSEDDVKAMQADGIIPNPLPSTGIAPMTYVMSFLGYGLIALILGVGYFIKART